VHVAVYGPVPPTACAVHPVIVVAPSLNETVPVGAPAPGATGASVAVSVTGWPYVDGLTGEAASVVVVVAWLTV
jgi:hypothetical protein